MIISISGLDGSGKSTQAGSLVQYLEAKGVKCRRWHLIKDSFTYFLTHRVIGVFSAGTKEKLEEGIRHKERKAFFYLLSAVKKTLLLAELLYFDIRYGWLKGKKGKALVCDRYFYDAVVQARHLGIMGKVFSALYGKFIIKPDFAFYLETPPQEAFSRKAEFDMGYFNEKAGLYDKAAEDSGLIRIGPAGPEKVFSELLLYISRNVSGTWK